MTLTKRDLVIRISSELKADQDKKEISPGNEPGAAKTLAPHPKVAQQTVLEIVQKTLDYIAEALANGDNVELRNFGVFEVRVRKARIGRNPHAPETDVPIPRRSIVRFKAGKELRNKVLKLAPEAIQAKLEQRKRKPQADSQEPQ
jgi:nucleoid DNA-binding protein